MRFALCFTFLATSLVLAQDETSVKSGIQPGALLPGPFESLNINGPAKGRYHCLVCKYNLSPVVMIFAREPAKEDDAEAKGNEAALATLLQKLDAMVDELQVQQLGACVVFLSPDARSSVNNPKEADAEKLVQEAAANEALSARLGARAEKLKNVVVASHIPEGPKDYQLNPKADVTVLFYHRLRVVGNHAYAPGAMTDADAETIVQKVREKLAPAKKKTPAKSDT